jgi:hypothetical protein
MTRIRNKEINRRRQFRKRVGILKKKLVGAKTEAERNHLIELIKRRQPYFVYPKK